MSNPYIPEVLPEGTPEITRRYAAAVHARITEPYRHGTASLAASLERLREYVSGRIVATRSGPIDQRAVLGAIESELAGLAAQAGALSQRDRP